MCRQPVREEGRDLRLCRSCRSAANARRTSGPTPFGPSRITSKAAAARVLRIAPASNPRWQRARCPVESQLDAWPQQPTSCAPIIRVSKHGCNETMAPTMLVLMFCVSILSEHTFIASVKACSCSWGPWRSASRTVFLFFVGFSRPLLNSHLQIFYASSTHGLQVMSSTTGSIFPKDPL